MKWKIHLKGSMIISALLLLAGCQLFEPRPTEPPAPEPEPPPAPVEIEPEPEQDPPLVRAIDLLQDGDEESAAGLLAELVEAGEGGTLAERLLRQVREPPEALLGYEFVEVTVQPGQSLSQLAKQYAGDPMMFHSLARLNDIERPRLLTPGMVIRVPVIGVEIDEEATDEEHSVVDRARVLAENGELPEALELLIEAAGTDELSEPGRAYLVELGLSEFERHLEVGNWQAADAALEKVEPWAMGREMETIRHGRDRIAAELAFRVAGHTDDNGRKRELLIQAVDLDPDHQAARRALIAHGVDLVDHYHDRALKAWRDQDVETAVQLWERVVEIDPEFRPARIYLERAQELLERLESM